MSPTHDLHGQPTNGPRAITKAPTGIAGLDELTAGGLPAGRPTLIAGGPGCGKTIFGLEFLVRGALCHDEPGVLMAFEETESELVDNARALGFDLPQLAADGRLVMDFVRVERSEIEETGEYDLGGLFVRLGHAIDSIKARRVVLDTLEALFAGLPNEAILRAELRRLFRWLKDRGVTAIITAERGDGPLTRHGLEEYVSDCVIVLDHRVTDQVSTRRLRVVKYRGSTHGTNEYPFLIGETGISVLPITSLGLHHPAPTSRVSAGIAALDAMLGGGYFRGSSVLVSGTPGTGKTSLASHFVEAACARGERCQYFAFEESPAQIQRNMRSIGLDLARWSERDLLRFHPARPESSGLETHLALLHRDVVAFNPAIVIVDPLTSLQHVGAASDARSMVARMVDFLKSRGITALFTSLTSDGDQPEQTEVGMSSLIDTWLLVRNLEHNGERNRGMYILKSRGTSHSNQIREFRLTDRGAELLDVYRGPSGVLAGTARLAQEARDQADAATRQQEGERRRRAIEQKGAALEARIAALRAEFAAERAEYDAAVQDDLDLSTRARRAQAEIDALRGFAATGPATNGGEHVSAPRTTGSRTPTRRGPRAR
ncbi:MAG: circadian clock protein KaiC [Vicinamibacterales bacterium]